MIKFSGMPQATADALRAGAPDAYGMLPEKSVSDGAGNPCRCCLSSIPKNAPMFILAYQPFTKNQPYAETGPVFLCADTCTNDCSGLPEVLRSSPDYLVKAYSYDERIIYGTGQITLSADIESYARTLLKRENVAFVDIRSSRNNCWQARITRI